MQAYLRYIHKISQNPENDTVGPFTVEPHLELGDRWKKLQKMQDCLRKARNVPPREEDGGAVFFLSGIFHSLIFMPVGSDMHRKFAPPSHFEKGGPLYEDKE